MGEKIKKVLEYIDGSILGAFFNVDGKVIRFTYNPETKGYYMVTDKKRQDITLNELLVLLNRPELKEAIDAKVQEIDSEKNKAAAAETQYLSEIDALDVDEEEKNRLRLLVKQILLPEDKVGMGNRVPVVDPVLEAKRQDYFDHRKEYDKQREDLLAKITELEKRAEYATVEEAEEIQRQIDGIWEDITKIPNAPVILSQHIRTNEEGKIILVTSLDENMNMRNYKQMTISEVSKFVKGKELQLDEELIKLSTSGEPEKE